MTDIVEVTDNGLVIVDDNAPTAIVQETNFQIVEVIGAGPPGPPGTPNPPSDGGDELGTTALRWGGLWITENGFIDFASGDIRIDHSADTLTFSGGTFVFPSSGLQVGSSNPFSDSAGTLTLQNIDALDATTEATIEAAIDTLANLTSIQGRTVTLGGNFTIAGATTISTYGATLTDDADAATARQTLGLVIGTDVQAYDADLASWALLTRASGFDTFTVTPSVANLMALLTNDAAGLGDFMVTPSSANLRTLVTDETGTGALVFGTTPTFTTSMLLSSGFVFSWSAGDVTLTHSADTLTMAGGQLVLPAAGLTIGASIPFSDSAGVLTLQNVDALDATTEATIEAAIDTLANLTSIQGRTVSLGGNFTIAGATTISAFGATLTDDADAATARATLGVSIGSQVQAWDADLDSWALLTRASGFDTFVVTPSSANLRALLTDETGTGAAVFGTTPTFTTSMLLSSGFVFSWNAGDVTLTHSADTLTIAGGSLVLPAAGLTVGASVPFSDAAGVLTLQNVDALDATTEATIEAAIDTLANLTSIQGVTFTFGSYAATILNNTSELGFKQAVNLEIGVDVQAYDADLASWAGVTRASGFDTFAATPSSANLRALLTDETGTGAAVFADTPTLITPNIGAATGTSLALSSGTGLTVGSSIPFSDAAGVLTLQNVDALDATTEATIEAAIDTLANLTSVQGRTISLGGNFTIAGATTISAFGATLTDDADASAARSTLGLVIGTNVQAWDADLDSWAAVVRASGFDTFVATPSSANLRSLLTDETGTGSAVFATAPAISDPDFTGLVDIQQTFAHTGDISPAQITADQNDYAPTGLSTATVLRLNTDAARTITGLTGGSDGRIIFIHNVGTNDLVLADESASSTAANRFALAAAVTLAADQSALLMYDSTSSRWRMIGGTGSGGGGGSGDVSAAANFGVDNRVIRSDGSLKGVQFANVLIDDTTATTYPETNDSGSLGKASFGWADLYLASGGLIYVGGNVWRGGARVSATAPTNPHDGDLWYDTNDGTLMVYFNDGTSSQWAQVSAYAPSGVLTSSDIGVSVQAYDADTAKLDAAANFTSTLQRGGSNVIVASDVGTLFDNPSVLASSQATTSGTSKDFTSIPSWVNEITVTFEGVSTSGTSVVILQIGTGGTPTTSGYTSLVGTTSSTVGVPLPGATAATARTGAVTFRRHSGNQWVAAGVGRDATTMFAITGVITLAGALDIVRLTTTNGTDTFDAGSVNISYRE